MKTLPFLLLLACLLNTALSQPTGTSIGAQAAGLAHHPDQNTVIPGSFPAAVSQSADSPLEEATEVSFPATAVSPPTDAPLEAATEVSHPDKAPVLPYLGLDILLKIASLADPWARRFIGNADKALRFASNFYCTLEDIKKINNSRRQVKALYQAIAKKDISAFKRLFQEGLGGPSLTHSAEERIYGLELAARYDSPQAAWILLAYGTLEKMTNAEEREELRGDAERRLTETQLADLAQITAGYNPRDRQFLRNVIAGRMVGFDISAPTKQARLFGLQLAIRYGTNTSIFMLLAFGTSDWDMDSEDIKKTLVAAKEKLPQRYLDFLQKIEDSAPEKRIFWRHIAAKNRFLPPTAGAFVSDHDTAIVGMQLSLMNGSPEVGRELLLVARYTDLEDELVRAAAALVKNADESENFQQHWKEMKEHCLPLDIPEL